MSFIQIQSWQAFFTTVAGLAATLAGLLFVGLGLNPRIMAPNGPPGMRVLAAQTFHHFLVLLVISLIALAPTETARPLAVTLLIVSARRPMLGRGESNSYRADCGHTPLIRI